MGARAAVSGAERAANPFSPQHLATHGQKNPGCFPAARLDSHPVDDTRVFVTPISKAASLLCARFLALGKLQMGKVCPASQPRAELVLPRASLSPSLSKIKRILPLVGQSCRLCSLTVGFPLVRCRQGTGSKRCWNKGRCCTTGPVPLPEARGHLPNFGTQRRIRGHLG